MKTTTVSLTLFAEVAGQAVVQVLVELCAVRSLQTRAQAEVGQLHVTLRPFKTRSLHTLIFIQKHKLYTIILFVASSSPRPHHGGINITGESEKPRPAFQWRMLG